jgi:hypothetical protein
MQLLINLFMRFVMIVTVIAICRAQSNQSTRNVSFAITDCWGNPVPSAIIHISSIEPQSIRERLVYPAETRTVLRQGRYHALIEAQGFFPYSSVFQVSDADLEHRSCLTLAPIEGTIRPRIILKGSVSAELTRKDRSLWTRLVGLYSNIDVTASVDNEGHFSFLMLQPGRYLVLLMDASGIRIQKQLDVREPATAVNLP